jgi:hypothetical protein
LQTSRVYVYQPLIWRPRGEKATVPLSAFLRGPTLGTISDAVFQEVCPLNEIVHISLVVDHMRQWDEAKKSLDADSKCIVVDDWLFNWKYAFINAHILYLLILFGVILNLLASTRYGRLSKNTSPTILDGLTMC